MAFNIFDNNKFRNKQILRCSYSCGGGMLGGIDNITINRIDDTKGELVIQTAQTHMDRIVTTTYEIDLDVFDEIKKIINDNNLYASSKKGKSPYQVLDGDTVSLRLTYDDYDGFSISDYQNLNKNDFETISKIRSLMIEAKKGDGVVSIEPHELSLVIDGYNIIYYMNDCKAADQITELFGLYMFEDYLDTGKMFHLEEKLDISDCKLVSNDKIGVMAYYEPTNSVIFFYKEFEPVDGLYELGSLDYDSESSFDLIKSIENKEYYLNKFK